MGMWGFGPTQSDDASDLIATVRAIVDEAWEPLREDARDPATLARAEEAAAIVEALGASAIYVTPDDALDVAELDGIPATVTAALSTEWPSVRPAFGDERAVEKHLREANAPYELWNWAARFGDDRDAAWRACADPDHLVAIAQAYGIEYEAIQRAVAACVAEIVGGPEYREPPFDVIPDLVAAVARGDRIGAERMEAFSDVLRGLNEARQQAYMDARLSGRAAPAGDPRLAIFNLAYDVAKPRRRGGTRWITPLERLVDEIPDLTQRLRDRLSLTRDR